MNLFFGGQLGNLMRPHFVRRVSPFNFVKSILRQNVLFITIILFDLVQRSLGQFHDHNNEELQGQFTRPTLDLYVLEKFWGYLTNGLSKEEVQDFERAKEVLTQYEKLYSVFEYCTDLQSLMTTVETRIAQNNPSVPMTIYRKSAHNSPEEIFKEMELVLQAYYNLLDNMGDNKEWVRKVEEDIGQSIAYMAIGFDESDRDILVGKSELFNRFDLEKQKFFK